MPRPLLLLCLLLTACTPTAAPNELVALGNVRNTATAEAGIAQATALPITQSAYDKQISQSATQTFAAPALTQLAQQAALTDIAITQKWNDITATAAVRATQSVEFSEMRATAIPATGTALAVSAQTEQADANTKDAVSRVVWVLYLIVIACGGIGVYWLFGRAQANIKKANTAADNNKPQVFEDVLVYPSPAGGYIHQRLPRAPTPLPALAPPAEIQERIIGGQTNGKPHFITKSEPVNEHEARWREFLVLLLRYAQANNTFASKDLAGVGKPLSSNDHWMAATKVLADNNLILKDNGDKTVRAGEWGDLIARVQDATHPLVLPERLPPRFRVYEAEKVQ